MIPTRQKLIGGDKVEEHMFGVFAHLNKPAVFVNGIPVSETYDQAVARLEREA